MKRSGKSPIPELLAPAGSFEKLVTAIHYGADAVYLGGRRYSLRARAANFDADGIRRAVDHAHARGVRVYVTVNIFAHNEDLEGLADYLLFLRQSAVDGLIIADPGILATARDVVPGLAVHLSTQANVTNLASARFWASQGVHRLNLARELGLQEIRRIRRATDIELEVFVHGALCISYSGRCMLSAYLTGRDANRGDCAQPCRYSYRLVEEKRPGHYFPVVEDERGTYIFNSRDLCLLERLPELVAAGVDSVKIEGRMKSMAYVGSVVRLYRAALDWIGERISAGSDPAGIVLPQSFRREMNKIGTRGQTENFFAGRPSSGDMIYGTMRAEQTWVPVGFVTGTDPLVIETRNPLEPGETVEYLGRGPEPAVCTVTAMETEDGAPVLRANPGTRIVLHTDPVLERPEINSILRKQRISHDTGL
ncbi:MAG TPA: U32 family peptidase [Desulfobulbus sp.]|nr:U32 family peptidase [Desulfobulbus sp.]